MRFANAIRVSFCAALLAGAPAAAADGVHTDPSSPTAKEYAIPLDSARKQAAAGSSQTGQGGGAATTPLFGAGVTAPASTAKTSAPRASHRHPTTAKKKRRPAPHVQSVKRTPAAPTHRTDAAAIETPSGGLGTPLLVAGVAAVVLLAGGLGGLALRRRGV